MKNKMDELFYGRNLKLSVLLVLGVFMVIGLGCFGGRKTAGTIPAAYLGDWQGQDGTTLSIRSDGTGDYHAGSTKVDGGTAEVDEAKKTLSITFFGIGKTLKIDQPPAGNQMTLDGMVYRHKGSSTDLTVSNTSTSNTSSSNSMPSSPTNKSPFSSNDSTTMSPSKSNPSQTGLPSNVEIETLVKATIADFTSGVEEGDFSNFRLNASKDFQATLSAPQVNTQFQVFIDQKDTILPSLRDVDSSSVEFSEPPYIRTEKGYTILVADGSIPTSPRPTSFQTEYELEKGRWKMLTFKIRM